MLQAFWAVLTDLFHFVFPVKVRADRPVTLPEPPTATAGVLLSPPKPRGVSLESGSEGYVAVDETLLYSRPIVAFDTKLADLPFGTVVSVRGTEGAFTHVSFNEMAGWMLTTDLVFERAMIFPQLESKTVYEYSDPETMKIRVWIKDECLGGRLFLPLQPFEYVLYELQERGMEVAWPSQRPRTAGTLQNLLRGNRGVRITIEPKTGSIMEYHKEDKTGVIAMIEAVHPDDTIVVRSVGKEQEGEYLEETLPKAKWRELRPVFISFV